MKDQVSTSLRKLAEKQRDFDEAIVLCEREKEKVVGLGNSARGACENFFTTLADQVKAKHDLTIDLEQQQSEKVSKQT